jgi:hypothetical protein
MGARFITIPALAFGVCVAACSKPTVTADRAAPTRDLRLASEADSNAVVSDLEAGRARPAGQDRLDVRADRPAARTAKKVTAVSVAAQIEAAPKMVTSNAPAEVRQDLAVAPVAPAPVEQVESVQYNGGGTQMSDGGGFSAAPISRLPGGPSVIIRGGRGGIDDDCDIHRPGIRRFGTPGAVHQVMPTFGGYPRGSR